MMVTLKDGRRFLFNVWFEIFVAPELRAEIEFNLNQRMAA